MQRGRNTKDSADVFIYSGYHDKIGECSVPYTTTHAKFMPMRQDSETVFVYNITKQTHANVAYDQQEWNANNLFSRET